MEITQGPKKTEPLENFFDDGMTKTSREILFDGKRYCDLTKDEHKTAMSAWERKRKNDRGAWMFVSGIVVFCWACSRF